MAKFYDQLTPKLIEFIQHQHLFFTASGTAESRINLSPKGMDTFRVISPQQVAYLDVTGSGNETAAHLKHDGRLTFMFCSFELDPLILRLYGRGFVVSQVDDAWEDWSEHFETLPGTRQIVGLRIESVQTSCGYGVPEYEFRGDRPKLIQWAQKKGDDGIRQYWQDKNQVSIDGLPTGLNGSGALQQWWTRRLNNNLKSSS